MVEIGNKAIIIIIVISGLYTVAECLRCYSCTSIDEPDRCGPDFKLNSTDTQFIDEDCANCLKTILKHTKTIVRNCEKKQSHKVSIRSGCSTQRDNDVETKTCSCTSDLCNTAETTFYPVYLVIICLTIFACMFH